MNKQIKLSNEKEYTDKPEMYFSQIRKEIEPFLPSFSEKVLDVGCGTGENLFWLKSMKKCNTTYGIELSNEAGKEAKRKVDNLIVGDIEQINMLFDNEKFHLILFLDVLEHLTDPWTILDRIVKKNLHDDGIIIASIPNIRYYVALFPLLFRAQWEYSDSGVLDRTHLRFFTKNSALDLVSNSGLEVLKTLSFPADYSKKIKLFSFFTFGIFKDFLTQQYIISAKK